MAISLLFIVLRIPIWPRLAKYRATLRARCVACMLVVWYPAFSTYSLCAGYKNRSNNAEPFQKDLLSSA